MWNVEAVQLNSSALAKAVYDFSRFERCTDLFFNLGKDILQIGVG